jgi:hypothetical protein
MITIKTVLKSIEILLLNINIKIFICNHVYFKADEDYGRFNNKMISNENISTKLRKLINKISAY